MSTNKELQRFTGTVKWFNNKAGFGFITVCDEGNYKDKDIFVHYSSIRVTNSQYKYLVQGEYVDFSLFIFSGDTHEYQAIDICGIKNGPIMCESKNVSQQYNKHKDFSKKSNDDNGFVRVEKKRNRQVK